MERLTERMPDGFIRYNSRQGVSVLGQLARYEDTGLTPEEIMDGKMLTGWISVEDRLPKNDDDVLILSVDKQDNSRQINMSAYTYVTFGGQKLGQKYWASPYEDFDLHEIVTHWMPMPKPPKGEE